MMKSIFRNQLWATLLAVATLTACNNGDPADTPDANKVLDHLIIEEVCYSGSWHETWNSVYKEDRYIKITNPTDKVIYLDGMALAQSGLTPRKIVNLRAGTDYRNSHFGASMLIRFPGNANGQEYPINAGQSVYIAKVAYNHTKPTEEGLWCKNSYDLSKVNFEWATVDQIKNDEDYTENPGVPNMLTVYPIDKEDTGLPLQIIPEYGVLALVKIPADITNDMLLNNDTYRWSTIWSSEEKIDGGGVGQDGGGHSHDNEYDPVVFLKLPNEWIVDAVQICPQHDFQWSVVSDKIDKGHCSVYTSSSDKNRNPKEYTGKTLKRKHDGKKFVDTDNSSIDFEVATASLATPQKP